VFYVDTINNADHPQASGHGWKHSLAYNEDRTPPTVTVNQATGQSDPTSSSPINFTVVFSEAVTGFVSGDVILGGTAGANASFVRGSGASYNVEISGMTRSGTVTATIPAGSAQDAAGNGNLASTSADNSVTYNPPPPGTLHFAQANYSVNENAGTVTLNVTRTGGSSGAVSVQYDTANGSAVAPGDFSAISGTLDWTNGATVSMPITVAIVNDSIAESSESFTVTLSNPTGGATLGSPAIVAVTILDDYPATLQLTGMRRSNGVSRFTLNGPPGNTYSIQASSNLVNWVPLSTHTIPAGGTVPIVDSTILNQPHRFYRGVTAPTALLSNMVWIPGGTFTMGSPETEAERYSFEGPQTHVTISHGFWMGKFEVTQEEYLEVVGSNPSGFTSDLRLPVEHVSWSDAVAYCTALTQRERTAGRLPAGYACRLPTEAEWEYACRAGTTTAFHYGQALRSGMANFYGTLEYDASLGTIDNPSGIFLDRTTTVRSYAPNAWGLYDMHGNVWEWCQDWWTTSLPGGSIIDPKGTEAGVNRVIRGAAYSYRALHLRSAYREGSTPDSRTSHVGFRVVLASE
jgi:formylglycine-generating enzyme required for sulfatase activity